MLWLIEYTVKGEAHRAMVEADGFFDALTLWRKFVIEEHPDTHNIGIEPDAVSLAWGGTIIRRAS